jgi:hypothetical protein
MKIMTFVLVVFFGLLAAGCSQPPTEAVNGAKTALEAARDAGAADYAPESLGAAEDALSALDAELATQAEKFALLRSYEKAGKLAAAAQAAGNKAAEDAAAGKEAARTEAMALIEGVRTSLQEVKVLLAEAPRGKGTRAEIDAITADVAAVEPGLKDFEARVAGGSYLEARAKAQAAQETLNKVKAEIQGAIAAKRRRG